MQHLTPPRKDPPPPRDLSPQAINIYVLGIIIPFIGFLVYAGYQGCLTRGSMRLSRCEPAGEILLIHIAWMICLLIVAYLHKRWLNRKNELSKNL